MKKLKISIFMILIMILAVSAVSAADVDGSSDADLLAVEDATVEEVVASDDTGEASTAANDAEVISADDGNNFTSLQTLINEEGKTNLTLDNDYTRVDGDSDIVINKDFTIDGQGKYTLDANKLGRIFKVNTGSTLTLIGVTLVNGLTSDSGAAISSEGILIVDNCVFKNHNITTRSTVEIDGAAIASLGSKLTVTNSNFTDNIVDYVYPANIQGGAIGSLSNEVLIDNCIFINNPSSLGAIMLWTSDSKGKAIINNSKFENNYGYTGGAIFAQSMASVTINNTVFKENSGYQGGAIFIDRVNNNIIELTVDNSEFIGNTVYGTEMPNKETWASGGAIFTKSKMTIVNSNFTKNYAEYNGAAIYYQIGAYVGDSLIENCRFEDNNAGSYYGAVYYNGWDSLTVKNSDFINNTADKNRAGALYFNARNLNVIGGEFINNTASEGGAIYYTNAFVNLDWATDDYKKLTIDGATFKDNTASINGGAIYINNGLSEIRESSFVKNTAKTESNAVYLNNGNLVVSDNTYDSENAIINNGEGTITKPGSTVIIYPIEDINYGNDVEIEFTVENETNIEISIFDVNNESKIITSNIIDGKIIVSNLPVGTYNITIKNIENNNYASSYANATFNIVKTSSEVTIDLVDMIILPVNNVNVTFTVVGDGDVTITVVDVNNESRVISFKNDADGKVVISDLVVGDYMVAIKLDETSNYNATEANITFSVRENAKPADVIIPELTPGKEETVTIVLPENATGTINVTIDGEVISTINVNGTTTVSIPSTNAGNHNIEISYSGDDNYAGFTVKKVVNIKSLAKITGSKVTAYYNDGSVYKVRVLGDDGKAAVGASVVIKVNGKKVATLKTDKNGYATYKIIQTPKSSYTFTAEANSLKTTNKIVVKQVIKAKKTTKIKKSKASKIKITLKGKKIIKNTKVTVKFKGKKYTVKISKKGVGYFKIKKNMAKKLKKGKKYSYTITYKKDTLKRFIQVKK